jgi:hypothetical protein
MVDDNDETLNDLRLYYDKEGVKVEPSSDIIPVLYHYGIGLHPKEYAHPDFGNSDPDRYNKWVAGRRVSCETPGWLVKNIAEYGGNFKIHLLKPPYLPNQLMKIIWKLTDSPTGTPLDQIIINRDKSLEINSDIQLPFISWLNKKELIQINSRLKDLTPNKDIPDGKTLWEFTLAAQDIIKGWFVRNDQPLPDIAEAEQETTLRTQFNALIKQALEAGLQSEKELWEWKARFEELPGSYFRKYEQRTDSKLKQGPGSKNGLEWRTNPDFRSPRTKTQPK